MPYFFDFRVPFQFHNGTIKTYAEYRFISNTAQFQFHNGTIKTNSLAIRLKEHYKFQFHNGTIKTSVSCTPSMLA